ncbi:hypothetical protein Vadar_004404 [Vaccinium darrowii]|uniref:Uncharacterized protein n=1 Tax=Vaccinium darrowii TaxID=229202 RepID=A0ACB7X7I0_9ERIC|nr:hypothetical protein Vadar_004404 [Vaccinium darrowii]
MLGLVEFADNARNVLEFEKLNNETIPVLTPHFGNKVESKGRTTYSEVAHEIVAEFTESNNSAVSLDKVREKNTRRRVYDALNVPYGTGRHC